MLLRHGRRVSGLGGGNKAQVKAKKYNDRPGAFFHTRSRAGSAALGCQLFSPKPVLAIRRICSFGGGLGSNGGSQAEAGGGGLVGGREEIEMVQVASTGMAK